LLSGSRRCGKTACSGELDFGDTLCRQFQISQWDASMIAAALELGCHTLYSENLNSGQIYSSTRVINPFQQS
jgi:predicted nucleic acid-binding protein